MKSGGSGYGKPFSPRRRVGESRAWISRARLLLLGAGLVCLGALGASLLLSAGRTEVWRAIEGTVRTAVTCEAFLVKREHVVVAPVSGSVRLVVAEGEKVAADTATAEIVDVRAERRARVALERAEEELASFLERQRTTGEELGEMVEKARQQFLEEAKAVREAQEGRRYGRMVLSLVKAYFSKRRLDGLVMKATRLEEERRKLERRVEEAEAELGRAVCVLKAPVAGVVSLGVDGLERRLVPELAGSLRPGDLQAATTVATVAKKGQKVEAGQPVLKIVDLSLFVLVVPLTGQDGRAFLDRASLAIRLVDFGERELTCTVRALTDSLLVLDGVDLPSDLAGARRLRVELVKGSFTGILVPAAAVVEHADGKGVYVRRGRTVLFTPVEVLGGDDEWVAVEGLSAGAEVLFRRR